MADLQNLDDFKVVYKGCTYSLLAVPADDSPIVQERTGVILQDLKPGEITQGLAIAEGLLQRAYVSFAEIGRARAEVLWLQHDFMDACTEARLAFDDCERSSRDVLANLTGMARFLMASKTEFALKYFDRCAVAVAGVSERAASAARRFRDLGAKDMVLPDSDKYQCAKALGEAALFWERIGKFCSLLNSTGFQADVAMLKDSPDEMIRMLRTDDATKQDAIAAYASWSAFAAVLKRCQDETGKLRQTVEQDFESNPH